MTNVQIRKQSRHMTSEEHNLHEDRTKNTIQNLAYSNQNR